MALRLTIGPCQGKVLKGRGLLDKFLFRLKPLIGRLCPGRRSLPPPPNGESESPWSFLRCIQSPPMLKQEAQNTHTEKSYQQHYHN